jgi:hypothetical protein
VQGPTIDNLKRLRIDPPHLPITRRGNDGRVRVREKPNADLASVDVHARWSWFIPVRCSTFLLRRIIPPLVIMIRPSSPADLEVMSPEDRKRRGYYNLYETKLHESQAQERQTVSLSYCVCHPASGDGGRQTLTSTVSKVHYGQSDRSKGLGHRKRGARR